MTSLPPRGLTRPLSRLIAVAASGVILLASAQSISAAEAASSVTMWGASTPAGVAAAAENSSVELGTRFTPRVDGSVNALKFYKTSATAGTHTGALWSPTGVKLATATFTNESSTGWQSAVLTKAVSIKAGQTYTVSYHAPYGRYAYTSAYSTSTPASSVLVPGDGVYRYGSSSAYPTSVWGKTKYWTDIQFVASTSTAPTPTVTPTASPTTTPTASPTTTAAAGALNCVAKPSGCGYPDATNAGVSGGVALKRVPTDVTSGTGWTWDPRGWITAGDNAIVENLIIPASVDITGKNAIVRNNQITVTGEGWAVALRHATNATVQNNEIGVPGATRLMVGIKDIYGDSHGTKVIGNDITNASTGIQIGEGLIEANYIHDLGFKSGDHINGTTSNGGTTQLTIRGNTILNKFDQTDAISLFQDFGVEANRLITGNLVAGGGYTIYGGDNQNFGKTYNIKITNNRFSTLYFPNGGYRGPYAAYDPTGAGNQFSGNIWDHTGLAVT